MSERALSAELVTRILAREVRPAVLIEAVFPDETKRVWTGDRTITWNSQTWSGVGGAIGLSGVQEDTDTAVSGVTASINGLDSEFVNDLLSQNYGGGGVVIWLGFWDEAETSLEVMDDPLWSGILDTDHITDDGKTASIEIKAEHFWVDILRRREFRCTDQDQQLLYPGQGDTFFNKIEQIQEKTLPWGRTQA